MQISKCGLFNFYPLLHWQDISDIIGIELTLDVRPRSDDEHRECEQGLYSYQKV